LSFGKQQGQQFYPSWPTSAGTLVLHGNLYCSSSNQVVAYRQYVTEHRI